MSLFDPNSVGVPNGNYFGMPSEGDSSPVVLISTRQYRATIFSEGDSSPVVLISAPWDATVSYRDGTARGPAAIIAASTQVDLYDEGIKGGENLRIGTDRTKIEAPDTGEDILASDFIKILNTKTRADAKEIIATLTEGRELTPDEMKKLERVNSSCRSVNFLIEHICEFYHKRGQIPGVVGGEHGVALGAIKAATKFLSEGEELGLVQFDAHADLRASYEGFHYSHASVMYNALEIPAIGRLCQIGIRDFCADEATLIKENKKIKSFTNAHLSERLFKGESWESICCDIVATLPKRVYISFDIDGLDPSLCPCTGTPVPGGLTFDMALFLLRKIAEERVITGFDLCEVAPGDSGEWDANVGARLLYKLSLFAAKRLLK